MRTTANGVKRTAHLPRLEEVYPTASIARIEANGDIDLDPGGVFEIKLQLWTTEHHTFRDKLLDLHEKPEPKGVLKVFRPIFDHDEALYRFLQAAEHQ